jgi:hypothetical protein
MDRGRDARGEDLMLVASYSGPFGRSRYFGQPRATIPTSDDVTPFPTVTPERTLPSAPIEPAPLEPVTPTFPVPSEPVVVTTPNGQVVVQPREACPACPSGFLACPLWVWLLLGAGALTGGYFILRR